MTYAKTFVDILVLILGVAGILAAAFIFWLIYDFLYVYNSYFRK